jgi:hypothetical protein
MISTTIYSFGRPILRYRQAYQSVTDPATGYHLIEANNAPVEDFMAAHCKQLAEITDLNRRRIVVENLMINQQVSLSDPWSDPSLVQRHSYELNTLLHM